MNPISLGLEEWQPAGLVLWSMSLLFLLSTCLMLSKESLRAVTAMQGWQEQLSQQQCSVSARLHEIQWLVPLSPSSYIGINC